MEPSNQMTRFLQASTTWKFAFLETHVFNYFILENTARYFNLNLKNKFLKNLSLISFT